MLIFRVKPADNLHRSGSFAACGLPSPKLLNPCDCRPSPKRIQQSITEGTLLGPQRTGSQVISFRTSRRPALGRSHPDACPCNRSRPDRIRSAWLRSDTSSRATRCPCCLQGQYRSTQITKLIGGSALGIRLEGVFVGQRRIGTQGGRIGVFKHRSQLCSV